MSTKTAPFSMRLDPELKRELQKLAERDHRSLTNYIELLLRTHVAKETHGKTYTGAPDSTRR
jgi:predicted transcriptional regulator